MTTQTQEAVPTGTWNLDKVHSDVAFAVDYMAGTFRGLFSDFDAQLVDGTLSGSAEVASIQVKDPNLEGHLQSPEFFDTEKYPQITFEAKDISRSGNDISVTGELTMKGHTEPVEIRGTVTEPQDDPFGNVRFGIRLEATVDRTQFGISWNNPLPSGEPALQNDVTLIADLQFVKGA